MFANSNSILSFKVDSKECFIQLFKLYYKDLCASAYRITDNSVLSEEIVQQIFFNIWDKRNNLKIKKDVRQYLFRAVHNRALTFLNQIDKKREVRIESVEKHQLFYEHDTLLHDELEQKIIVAVENIPGKAKKVFQLSRVEGKSNNEIANILNISNKGVEFHITNALRFLRSELKEYSSVAAFC